MFSCKQHGMKITVKILINSVGSVGDVNPFLSLGMALMQRGHEVIILSSGALKDHIEQSGLPFIEVLTSMQYDTWRNLPTDTHGGQEDIKAFSFMSLPSALSSANAILKHCDNGCIVIGMPLQSIGINFAKAKAPNKVIAIEAMLAPRVWNVAQQFVEIFNSSFHPYLTAICQQLNLAINTNNWFSWLRQFDQKLAFYPNWFNTHTNHFLTSPHTSDFVFYPQDDQQALSSELLDFINSGTPPIAFTFGSYVSTRSDLFHMASHVCKQLNVRAIFLTKYKQQLPNPLPTHVFHASYVSLQKLLPKLRLFVHHGGIGTLAQALRAGVPQLTCPMAYDQFDNAKALEQLHVAQTLPMDEITEEKLFLLLQQILQNQCIANNANTLATHRFNGAGVERLCEQVERYTL